MKDKIIKKKQEEKERENHFQKLKKIKKDKTYRKAGGELWVDDTMEDWPESDFRLFIGNIGNEVHDEHLDNAFRKYPSFQKCKVVRDRQSGKSKGYGFVSMGEGRDFLLAMNEMQGKYIGNRPIRISKSSWKDRVYTSDKYTNEVKFKKSKNKRENNINH